MGLIKTNGRNIRYHDILKIIFIPKTRPKAFRQIKFKIKNIIHKYHIFSTISHASYSHNNNTTTQYYFIPTFALPASDTKSDEKSGKGQNRAFLHVSPNVRRCHCVIP